jgi:hypothetical protein
MPKVSFASKDAYEPKLGFQEGSFEVLNAAVKVCQLPPSRETGEQSPPFLGCVLSLQKTDDQGNPTEDEPMEKILRIEKDLSKMRPGRADSRDDSEPEDLGDELETEGNVIYAEEGAKINKNSSFQSFITSLEDKGFKPEILGAGYMPDLVGLKAHAIAKKAEKRNIGGREIEPTYFVVDKILVRPYEATKKPAASATTRTATKKAAPAQANSKVTSMPTPAATEATAASDDAESAATAILIELSSELAGSDPKDPKKLYAMAYSRLVRDKSRDKKLDKEVGELFKNEEWLIEKSAELGSFTFEDGVFNFQAA